MSLEKVHLRKLLQLFDASHPKRISLLRADIRAEISKENGTSGDGGDFYVPFWADAKKHVAGLLDLTVQTEARIKSNEGRKRLYPELRDGFLLWWNEKRRWINEPFVLLPENPAIHFPVPGSTAVVKIENTLGLLVGGTSNRIIYPYFSEVPTLTQESARIGLWLLKEAMSDYEEKDLRILDIMRSKSFSLADTPLKGNEQELFSARYKALVAERKKLKKEY